LSSFHANRKENKMVSQNSAERLSPMSSSSDAKARAAEVPGAVLDPRSDIEVAPGGSGTINDPPGSDKPPGFAAVNLDLLA
jgi:hypothetical protein